ncbi:MAG: CDP-alcohol phosphatidyltransferase family protein [Methylococcaceae bacterium]|nr:CDP-alcohol phosphatidyltransferase family protein [Methylococcaceae bacterium]
MNNVDARRPLKTRNVELAKKIARYISKQNITPNQISLISIVFAALAGLCLLFLPYVNGSGRWLLPITAGVLVQCRLLCNLFDGMVAVEGGKHTKSGELFNDIPDRFADVLIIVSVGYSITVVSYGVELGWLAAILAIMTAYVRTLAASVKAPINFQGPMAKPHRMALITAACLLTAIESAFWWQSYSLLIALMLMILGCTLTLYNRITAAYRYLENEDTV